MVIYELSPKYDARASFYHKALVKEQGKMKTLMSYETEVCIVANGRFWLNKEVDTKLLFSQTTLRHIKEFLKQELELFDLTKQDLVKAL